MVRSSNNKRIIGYCIPSVILSFAALCISIIRCEPIELDWLGVLVGVLSLLVTVLLGYNIYTAIDLKRDWKEYREEMNYKIEDSVETLKVENAREQIKFFRMLLATNYAIEEYNMILSMSKDLPNIMKKAQLTPEELDAELLSFIKFFQSSSEKGKTFDKVKLEMFKDKFKEFTPKTDTYKELMILVNSINR